jgi:hypothetical protein
MQYKQLTGQLFSKNKVLLGTGWSGNGVGKNNPKMQNVKNVGCLPQGWYKIGAPYDSPHTGALTLPLEPYSDNEMFGRSNFKIHGSAPNVDSNGFISGTTTPVSEGCIIMPHDVRVMINNLTITEDINNLDNELEVIA